MCFVGEELITRQESRVFERLAVIESKLDTVVSMCPVCKEKGTENTTKIQALEDSTKSLWGWQKTFIVTGITSLISLVMALFALLTR
jgi:hypothetical protein